MDNKQRKLFWKLHQQLMTNISMQSYAVLKYDNELYEENTSAILELVDKLQDLINPPKDYTYLAQTLFG